METRIKANEASQDTSRSAPPVNADVRSRKIMFRRKYITDAVYVEQIRKKDRTLRRMGWIWPLLLLAMLYSLINIAGLVQRITIDSSVEKKIVYAGLFLGVIVGLLITMVAAQAGLCIKQWLDARQGFRTERLMLKFHDELQKMETSNHTSDGIRQPADGSPKPSS